MRLQWISMIDVSTCRHWPCGDSKSQPGTVSRCWDVRVVQLRTRLSSDASSLQAMLQAAPPASCSSRCGCGLCYCFASVASVMKELPRFKFFIPRFTAA